jgi:hypothetical protein
MSDEPGPDVSMTGRPSRAIDLHGFALKEFLEFVRKEDPSWLEGAHVRRSDDGHQRSGVVEGKVWLEVLMSDKAAEALARVLARAEAFDEYKADAIFSLRKALRLGDVAGT